MALAAVVQLYSGPQQTGSSYLSGLGVGERYGLITHSELASAKLLNSVESGTLDTSDMNLNLILFDKGDYGGNFTQLSIGREEDGTFWTGGPSQSALVVASNNANTTETRLSFVALFQSKWDSFLDQTLQGTKASRDGEPILTWRMFPNGDQAGDQYLSSDQTYLHIQQELLITMPWYWSNYHAVMHYWIELYAQNSQLQAWIAAWYVSVDSGAKSGKIFNQLAPEVESGMSTLQTQLNQNLAITAALKPTDVYLLPGTQLTSIGDGPAYQGNTSNDVTIVIVS
jgi:hypothetical protein